MEYENIEDEYNALTEMQKSGVFSSERTWIQVNEK